MSFITIIFISILSIIICVPLGWAIKRRVRLEKYIRNILIPDQWPLIGIAHKFFNKSTLEYNDVLCELTSTYKSPMAVWLGPVLLVALYDIDNVQTVLNAEECMDKGFLYDFFGSPRGIFCAKEEIWRSHRKGLNMAFNTKLLKNFLPNLSMNTELLIEKMIEFYERNESYDLACYIFITSLKMVTKNHMEFEFNFFEEHGLEQHALVTELKKLFISRAVCIWKFPELIYRILPEGKRATYILKRGRELIYRGLIDESIERVRERERQNLDPYASEDGCVYFMSRVIQLMDKGIFTRDDVDAEVETIMWTGTETNSIALPNLLLLLAMHPDEQEKCYQEICRVFYGEPVHTSDYVISQEQINKTDYVEMALKESMRLYPTGAYLIRKCSKDLQMNNYTIPEGTDILVSLYQLHRNKEYFGPDADQFKPMRFAPDNLLNIPQGAYLPFSSGPRNCIGIKYSMMTMMIMSIKMLANFKFSTMKRMCDIHPVIEVTMPICEPNDLIIERRPNFNVFEKKE